MKIVEEFQQVLMAEAAEDIVERDLINGPARHMTLEQIGFVQKSLSLKFRIAKEGIDLRVVGSSKLGFALHEKWDRNTHTTLPAFRPYNAGSDVDIAIVSPDMFNLIWQELGRFADQTPRMPWNSGMLGDYLVHGWIRPDLFPKNARLRLCDDWWELFRQLSIDSYLGRRKIRGALYYSMEQFRRYQIRSVNACKTKYMSEL